MRHASYFDTAEKVARKWVAAIEIMERFQDRVVVLRYEELVRSPSQPLATLAARLGVEEDGLPAGLVHTASVGRYQRELSAEDLQVVRDIAGPTMERLGYR